LNNKKMSYETLEQYINQGKNVFLTGVAGSGKSYCVSKLCLAYPYIDITSTTGLSSVAINGKTIHSFSGIGVPKAHHTIDDTVKKVKKSKNVNRVKECKTLVIDEISMLGATTLDLLNEVFKRVRKNSAPFGGIQVIFTGDMLQLPPINDNYCFLSNAWKELDLKVIHLTKLYRFTDAKYSEMLLRIRLGEHTFEDNKELFKRFFAYKEVVDDENFFNNLKIKPTYLYSKRIDVEDKNLEELDKLSTDLVTVKAIDTFPNNDEPLDKTVLDDLNFHLNLLSPQTLYIKVGAQVMLTINANIDEGLANGSRGVIVKIEDEYIDIEFLSGKVETFCRHLFEYSEKKKILATRYQFPIILAFALSIHKVQGATLDSAIVNCGTSIFEASQAYVALSRVRSLDGLYLESYKPNKIFCNEEALKYYKNLLCSNSR
jgi:ATP-dependent DNA helicase PIF1